MADLTVAIPTYNGEKRLPLVLDALRSQRDTQQFRWEVLVVDNNSHDETPQIVRSYQNNSSVPCRYCFEHRQGAGFARKRAMQESSSPLIAFLDDDNIPDATWVAAAYRFAQAHPNAGAFASQIAGEFETEIPTGFERLVPFLAITQRGANPRLYQPRQKILPPSAGLVLRKQAWLEAVPEHLILSGRTDSTMLTGEDTEMLAHIQRSNWEIWYNPAMQIVHKIPSTRLQKDYLLPFFRGIGLSRHVTRMLSVTSWQRPLMFFAYLLNDLRKLLYHLLKHGHHIQNNLVLACEFELFLHSFISPFYLWHHGYLKPPKGL